MTTSAAISRKRGEPARRGRPLARRRRLDAHPVARRMLARSIGSRPWRARGRLTSGPPALRGAVRFEEPVPFEVRALRGRALRRLRFAGGSRRRRAGRTAGVATSAGAACRGVRLCSGPALRPNGTPERPSRPGAGGPVGPYGPTALTATLLGGGRHAPAGSVPAVESVASVAAIGAWQRRFRVGGIRSGGVGLVGRSPAVTALTSRNCWSGSVSTITRDVRRRAFRRRRAAGRPPRG